MVENAGNPESVMPFLEPVVAEIDRPDEVLLELRVVLYGNGQENVHARFTGAASERQRSQLLAHAESLVRDQRQRPKPQ